MNRVLQYALLVDSFPLMIWSVHFSSASRPMSLRRIKEPGTLDYSMREALFVRISIIV